MLRLEDRHRLAVRAALLDGEPGEEAFASWLRLVPLEEVDHDEFRILPLIYLRAEERGCRVPEMGRMKGVYRQVWVRNTLLLQTCAGAVRLLGRAAIPTVLLKGIAMFARWTGTVGPRSMRDLDILVPRSDARRAARLLAGDGWRSTSLPIVEEATEADLDWWPGAPLTRADGAELDLHWRALPRNTSPDHVAMFWEESRPHEVMGQATRVLRPEDQLYHAMLHGARWTAGAGLDWIVDVASMLRACPQGLDWGRILDHAERDRSVPALAHQVHQLEAVLGIEAPIAGALATRRQSRLDRSVFRRCREPFFYPRRGEVTLVNLHADLVGGRHRSLPRALIGFLCRQWALERPADLIPETLFRCLGRPDAVRPWLARSGLVRSGRARPLPAIGRTDSLSDPERSPFLTGWSGPEPGGRWTGGVEAVLGFSDETGQRGDLPVALQATPYLTPGHRRLTIAIFANGRRCGAWVFEGEAKSTRRLTFTVPEAVRRLRSDALFLVICVRNPGRPVRTGESRDTRRLGLFLESISLGHGEIADPFATPVDFTAGRNEGLLICGWSFPEPEGRWTDGPRASLALQWPGHDEEAIEIRLVGRMFVAATKADQGLAVSANGASSPARIEASGRDDGVVASVRARPVKTDRGSGLRLDLSISRPTSPSLRGLSDDTRALGFRLERLELRRVVANGRPAPAERFASGRSEAPLT